MLNVTTKPSQETTIAILGTGIIGAPVARNLRKPGFKVRAWNRTRAKAEALTESGIEVAATPADAVSGADIVLTLLKDGPAVLEAMTEAAKNLASGTVWAQMSTVGIAPLERLAAFAEQHGLVFYDAPVQGTRQPAEQAQLIIIASGPERTRAFIQPVFDAIGKRTLWLSDEGASGASSRLKLALNNWSFTITHGAAESIAIARGLGVDPAQMLEVIKGGPLDSPFFQVKAAAILSGDYATSFSIANAVKDSELIIEAAKDAGIRADAAVAGLKKFRRALDAGHGDKDMAATYLATVKPDKRNGTA